MSRRVHNSLCFSRHRRVLMGDKKGPSAVETYANNLAAQPCAVCSQPLGRGTIVLSVVGKVHDHCHPVENVAMVQSDPITSSSGSGLDDECQNCGEPLADDDLSVVVDGRRAYLCPPCYGYYLDYGCLPEG
jgi:hypothetical protein